MNIRLRYKIASVVAVLAGVFLYGRCNRPLPLTAHKPATALPVADKEQIRVDPVRHTISIQTPTGIKTVTLPDKVSTVDVLKDGTVRVASPQFGFQVRPYLGWGYEQGGAVILGVDLMYFKRLDLGAAAYGWTAKVKPAVSLSYTVWSNTRLTATYNGAPGVFVTVRF